MMPFQAELNYHLDSAEECERAGYSTQYNTEMSILIAEKQDFYLAFPSRKARRRARKEGIKVGRWY